MSEVGEVGGIDAAAQPVDSSDPIDADPGAAATDTRPPGRAATLVRNACQGPFRDTLPSIEERLSGGLLAALRSGRDVHSALVRETGLGDEAPTPWDVRADRLEKYRRRLSADVLVPLRAALKADGPTPAIVDELRDALTEATERARALPATVDDVWAHDALEAQTWEGAGRRLRKAWARMFSAARKTGEARAVPVRAVAQHHLNEILAPEVDAAATGLVRDFAAWERDIELAWIEWGEAALSALVRAELPEEEPRVGTRSSEPEVEGEAYETLWDSIRHAAEAFDTRVSELVEACPLEAVHGTMSACFDRADAVLTADIEVAGSFVFTPEETHRLEPQLEELEKMGPSLDLWNKAVDNRLHLYEALLAILAGATAVQRRLVVRVREKHLAETKVLAEVADRLSALAAEMTSSSERGTALRQRLDTLAESVRAALQPTEAAIPPATAVDETIQSGSNATVEALLAMIRQAPATVELLTEDGPLPRGSRKIETRSLAFQELARQAFDALRIERIRSSTVNLVESIDDVRADVVELPNVFAFAFDAAKKELQEGEEGAADRARGLVSEGLLSMAESLRNAERSLHGAVRRAQVRLGAEVSEGSLGLIDRVAAGRVQARLLAARSHFSEFRAWINERWGPPVEAGLRVVTARLKALQRLASRGLRKGTQIVGTGTVAGAASIRTLRALSDPTAVLQELPLVYQRLFTLSPISDPSLLAARDGELAQALNRWKHWRSDDGVPLLVKSRPGSGVTSFLNVLGTRVGEDGGSYAQVTLDGRIESEATLAHRLADALGLEPASSLNDLAKAVFDTTKGDVPDAVTIDNLEHLYLRVPGGTDLIERLLTLMAETEPRIFWIGGITSSAWKLIATAEPTAVSQVDVLELDPLNEEGIREAVTVRHRRSGLPLRFQEPESGRRMLRQRLKRLRDREAYEDLLADDFFGQLERTSARYMRLALFQWMTAADFKQGDGVLMQPPQKPDFGVLESLGLTQNFTLKAFLEHRTLTLAEHDRIFRLPRHESYQIFESLQNRQLIQTVGTAEDETPARSEIEVDLRYRVRPLLVGAVISHLRGRNIFH